MAKSLKKGLFITFEGPEGCGKSTQSSRLYKELKEEGYDVILTREPGGTGLGEKIREILLDKDSIILGQTAELMLFEADRAQHVEELIKPSIEQGKIVICDRFNTATFAYQGSGLGMNRETIEKVDTIARCGISPDFVMILDVDVETGLKRAGSKGAPDRMEKRGHKFHTDVRQGYIDFADGNPSICHVVDATRDKETVYNEIRFKIYDLIGKHSGAK